MRRNLNRHWLSEMRLQLGLTQQKMAAFLGVATSLVKRIEIDERNLPFEALAPLLSLYTTLLEVNNEQADNTSGHIPPDFFRECVRKIEIKSAALEKMTEKYNTAARALKVYDKLLNIYNEHINPKQQRWIEHRIDEARRWQLENSLDDQAVLKAEIVALRGMIEK